jgi:hypothetical protein
VPNGMHPHEHLHISKVTLDDSQCSFHQPHLEIWFKPASRRQSSPTHELHNPYIHNNDPFRHDDSPHQSNNQPPPGKVTARLSFRSRLPLSAKDRICHQGYPKRHTQHMPHTVRQAYQQVDEDTKYGRVHTHGQTDDQIPLQK